jgi:hypothetical protein
MAIQKKSLIGNLSSTKKSAPAKAATPSVPSASANVSASMARPVFSKTSLSKVALTKKIAVSRVIASKYLPNN